MTFKEIKELIKLIESSNLAEFILEKDELSLTLRTKNYVEQKATTILQQPMASIPQAPPPVLQQMPAQVPNDSTESKETAEEEGNYLEIKSPIVGTFYRAPGPEKPPFVKVGDVVNKGDVVCIVEAMKLFNDIETEVSGKIVKVMAEDASPVEYDQVLYLVDPSA